MHQSLHQHLSRQDMVLLLSLSMQAIRCGTAAELEKIIVELQGLIGFEHAVCTQALVPDTFFDPDADMPVLNFSYPDAYFELYKEQRWHLSDTVWCCALTQMTPVNWAPIKRRLGICPSMAAAGDFNMHDGWGACSFEPGSGRCTLLFVTGSRPDPSLRTYSIIEHVMPFLSLAYTRVLKRKHAPPAKLTPKEIEVLNWLKEGKSSWEISRILNCSKRVIDFHAANIKNKLDAVSRAQSVAKAVAAGIIDL